VQEKDNALSGTPTASNTKTLSTGRNPATATRMEFFASDEVTITMTPDAFEKRLLTLLFSVAFL